MPFAAEIQLVIVKTGTPGDIAANKKLWVAAVPRNVAVKLIAGFIPSGWTAALSPRRLTPHEMALLKMRPGDIREWKTTSHKRAFSH